MTEPKPASLREYELRVNQAMDFIRDHLAEPLTLEKIAQAACFSSFHFHRIFNAVTGETVNDFLWRQRAERAANLLRSQPQRPVTDIALSCGFSSSSNFAKALKKHYGLNATQIRKTIEQKKSKPGAALRKPGAAGGPGGKYNFHRTGWTLARGCRLGEVNVLRFPTTRIAYIRVLNGYEAKKIMPAAVRLAAWADARGLFARGSRLVGLSHDNPDVTPWERCRFDLGVTLPADFRDEAGINTATIPEGLCAVYRFEGPSSGIENAFHYFYFKWLPGSGYQPADFPPFQIFLKDMRNDPKRIFLTDIYMMVQPL